MYAYESEGTTGCLSYMHTLQLCHEFSRMDPGRHALEGLKGSNKSKQAVASMPFVNSNDMDPI